MKICKICGKEFTPQRQNHINTQECCSKACSKKNQLIYVINWRKTSVKNSLSTVVAGCKNRAKRKNLDCDIDIEYMLALLEKQQGLCAATGIELEPTAGNGKSNRNPFTISVDRIDHKKGYTKDNVQLVCMIYNEAKNTHGHEAVVKMATQLINKNAGCFN